MKTIKKRFRKGTALLLACTMMAGVVTAMPGNIVNVKAATVDPSVTAYATKAQLMDGTFAPDSTSGIAANIGKLAFGKNSSRQAGSIPATRPKTAAGRPPIRRRCTSGL